MVIGSTPVLEATQRRIQNVDSVYTYNVGGIRGGLSALFLIRRAWVRVSNGQQGVRVIGV